MNRPIFVQNASKELYINTTIEKAVLGGLCQYGEEAHLEICDILVDSCFQDEINLMIYKTIESILQNQSKIDLGSILMRAESDNLKSLLKKDNKDYIKSLFEFPIAFENVRETARKLRRIDITQRLKTVVDSTRDKLEDITGDEKLDDILSTVENPIYDFCHNVGIQQDNEAEHLHHGLEDYTNSLENNPVDQIGIPTGFNYFDKTLGGGVIPGGFALIGARMKVGKSTLADQIALNTSLMGIPTLMLDTEMFKTKHWYRILANLSGIEVDEIRTGKYSLDEYKTIMVNNAKEQIKNCSYFYKNVAGKSFNEILGIARRWYHKHVKDTGLIILDYFKLSHQDSNSGKKEYELIGYQASQLSDFCIKYNMPCIAFVQLNRDGINREDTSVISQSDRLGWSCTSFSIFKDKTAEEIHEHGVENGNKKLITAISRDGESLDEEDYINVLFEGKYARVSELNTKSTQQFVHTAQIST